MANIIISESSGKFKGLLGEVQVPIASYIEERNAQDEQKCLSKFLFTEKVSTSRSEGYGGLTAADEMENVGEGAKTPENSFSERELKTIDNETFKSKIVITREMLSDCKGNLKMLIQRAGVAKLTSAYYRTRDSFLFGLLIAAAQNKAAYVRGNKSYNTKCYDGKILFSKTHGEKGNECNAFSDAFSESALGKLSTYHQNLRGEKGESLGITPDTIVIPNEYNIKKAVFSVIGADKDPGSGNNGFNYQFGQWNVLVVPALNALITSTNTPWFLFDSQYNEANDGNIFQNREDLEIKSLVTDEDDNVWKAYARFSGGFVDWRQIVGGGLAFGQAA